MRKRRVRSGKEAGPPLMLLRNVEKSIDLEDGRGAKVKRGRGRGKERERTGSYAYLRYCA